MGEVIILAKPIRFASLIFVPKEYTTTGGTLFG